MEKLQSIELERKVYVKISPNFYYMKIIVELYKFGPSGVKCLNLYKSEKERTINLFY